MNTTALIDQWSMDGAASDIERRFESAVDIIALVSELPDEPADVPDADDESAEAPADTLLVKRAGEDDWQPLVAAR